jgi:hypothetical protein
VSKREKGNHCLEFRLIIRFFKSDISNYQYFFFLDYGFYAVSVLNLVSQVRNVVLINVYLDLGNSGGSGFWNEGYMSQGRKMGS